MNSFKFSRDDVITLDLLKVIYNRAIDESSRVLSKSFKAGAKIEALDMELTQVKQLSSKISQNVDEYSAAIVGIKGEMPMKLLFLVDKNTSLVFSDLFLNQQPGTTKEVTEISKSVMQELGNVVASAISNMVYADLGFDMLPTPPVVCYGPSSSIISAFVSSDFQKNNEQGIYIIETLFNIVRYQLSAKLFIMPEIEIFSKLKIKLGE